MKKLLFLLLFLPFCGQAQQVSSMKILQNIKDQYPQADNIQMSGMSCGYYEATFFEKDEIRKVRYSRAGEWMETHSLIEKSELPSAAQEDIDQNFATLSLVEIIRKDRAEDGDQFEVRTEDGSRLRYDEAGARIIMNSCSRKQQ